MNLKLLITAVFVNIYCCSYGNAANGRNIRNKNISQISYQSKLYVISFSQHNESINNQPRQF